MTRKLAASRVLMWVGGRKPLTAPLRPRGSRSCPGFKAMLRWNSHAAASEGWYGCTGMQQDVNHRWRSLLVATSDTL